MLRRRTARAARTLPFLFFLAVLAGSRTATPAQQPPEAPQATPTAPPAIPGSQGLPERPPAPAPPLVVILDPAHGGADSGAHSEGDEAVAEKDIVLAIAQAMRRELERQGIRVVLTRQGDTEASINDRAAIANALPSGFFVTLHVGSTGDENTAQAYSFGAPLGSAPPAQMPRPVGLAMVRWEDAQASFAVASRRLAELLQVELAQKLRGSPDVPQFAEVRQLRVVAHPAVAIELSNVGEDDPAALQKTAAPLANALARALAVYRQSLEVKP